MLKTSLIQRAKKRYKLGGFGGLAKQTAYRVNSALVKKGFETFPELAKYSTPNIEVGCVEPTNACNLRCVECFSRRERQQGYMSWPLFRKVIDEYADAKVRDVLLHYGGESLLHPRFREFFAYAMAKRNSGAFQRVFWVDNAMLFTPDISDYVVELGLDDICFSMDGVGQVNDRIRLGARYDVMEKNIMYLLERRGKGCKPTVRINTVDFGKTPMERDELINIWTRRVDEVIFSPCLDTSFRILDKSYYGKLGVEQPYCYAPFNYIVACWNGDVTTCCADVENKLNLGNLGRQTLKEVWLGGPYRKLRLASLQRKLGQYQVCSTCEFWRYEFPKVHEQIHPDLTLYYEANKKIYRRSGC